MVNCCSLKSERLDALRAFQASSGERETRVKLDPEIKAVMLEMLHFGFGYGPRFCPGRSLGLLEVGLVVGAFVKLFKFKAVSDQTGVSAGVSTKPADGVMVDLIMRK